MYLRFDWSNNCGYFFPLELVKFILIILKRNFSPAKLQANKNAHARINFAAKSPFILANIVGPPPPSLIKGEDRTLQKLSHLGGGGTKCFARKGGET